MNRDLYDIALEHIDQDNYSQALICIEKYIDENPENKYGRLVQAIIYGHLSYYSKTLELLASLAPGEDDLPKYAQLYYKELGDTYGEMGNIGEALKWYDKAIKAVPDETTIYIIKGGYLAAIGEYELAKLEHLKATKLKGDPDEAYYNLAMIARAELKLEDAKAFCEKSLEIDPDNINVIHCHKDILDAIWLQRELKIN